MRNFPHVFPPGLSPYHFIYNKMGTRQLDQKRFAIVANEWGAVVTLSLVYILERQSYEANFLSFQ